MNTREEYRENLEEKENMTLENQNCGVLSEVDLLELLNIEKATLDELRQNEDFPFIRLNRKNRAYLMSDVVDWLKQHRRNAKSTF